MKWSDHFIALDVETTGVSQSNDYVIEVAMVTFRDGGPVDSWSTLIDPGAWDRWDDDVIRLTGIKPDDCRGKPPYPWVASEIDKRLASAPCVVAYNAWFDRGFLQTEHERCGRRLRLQPWLDPQAWARRALGLDHYSLNDVARALKLTAPGQAHRAERDATLAGAVAIALAEHVPGDPEQVVSRQTTWESERKARRWGRR